jgi:prepilin-type N-terminal cleavage/methylation domain-containing protein
MLRPFRIQNRRGFTLIELMVVVVVVGVLAAIAIAIYGKYAKNARVTEAHSRIGEIVTAAKSFAFEQTALTGDPTWPPVDGNYGIADLSPSENFTYVISSGGGAAATSTPLEITATGINDMSGVTVTLVIPSVDASGAPPVVNGL